MIRAALVGGGPIGLRHGKNFADNPNCEIVAVCDVKANRLETLKTTFKAPGFASVEEMLAGSDAELILAISSETNRLDLLSPVVAAGRHWFTEKPLSGRKGQFTVEDKDAIEAYGLVEACRSSQNMGGINFQYRLNQASQMLKEAVHGGALGKIHCIEMRTHFNCWSHYLDLILWIFGRPESVYAEGTPGQTAWPRAATLKWRKGTIGAVTATMGYSRTDAGLRLTVVGEEKVAEITSLHGRFELREANFKGELVDEWTHEGSEPEYEASFKTMADAVIEAVEEQGPMPADIEAGWDELLLEAAIHRSAASGKRITLAALEKEISESATAQWFGGDL